MADIRRLPFIEIVERVQKELLRDGASGNEAKYKGIVNSLYLYDIPPDIDWRHMRKESTITTVADYTTGYVTDASSTTITGDSDCAWTSANSNTLLIKLSGYDELYRCTYSSSTSLTIDRSWIGDAISSDEVSYVLFQDRYALTSDFDRMILDSDKAVFYWQDGKKIYLKYRSLEEFESQQVYQPNDPQYYTIKWINGDPYLFIDAPDTESRTLHYYYIPSLKRMVEYTTGSISTLANGGTAVTGSGTDFDGFVMDTTNYDYYFRIDDDGTGSSSVWYKISSADSDTGITLVDTYGGTSISGGSSSFTISVVSLLPSGLDLAIVYGAAVVGAAEQDNVSQVKIWSASFDRIMDKYKSIESKKEYGQQRMRTIYEKHGVRR